MEEFKSLGEILAYAKERDYQVFTVMSCDPLVKIGEFDLGEVYESSNWGYIDIVGLDTEQDEYIKSRLDGMNNVK